MTGEAQAAGASGFWAAASASHNLPSTIPVERWSIERFYAPDVGVDKMYVRFAAFLSDVDAFDAAAFR